MSNSNRYKQIKTNLYSFYKIIKQKFNSNKNNSSEIIEQKIKYNKFGYPMLDTNNKQNNCK